MAIGFAIHKAKRKVSPDLVTRYRTLPVANISDVMSRIAGTNRLRPMHAGGWLGGPALTVKTRPGDNLMVHKAIDLAQLAKLDSESAREEIRDIVNEIIAIKNIVMSIAEQEELLDDICNDVLGYGPLEPLLSRDDIADIMVNGSKNVYIEVNGKVEQTSIRFRDNQQLLNI